MKTRRKSLDFVWNSDPTTSISMLVSSQPQCSDSGLVVCDYEYSLNKWDVNYCELFVVVASLIRVHYLDRISDCWTGTQEAPWTQLIQPQLSLYLVTHWVTTALKIYRRLAAQRIGVLRRETSAANPYRRTVWKTRDWTMKRWDRPAVSTTRRPAGVPEGQGWWTVTALDVDTVLPGRQGSVTWRNPQPWRHQEGYPKELRHRAILRKN